MVFDVCVRVVPITNEHIRIRMAKNSNNPLFRIKIDIGQQNLINVEKYIILNTGNS